MGRLSGLSDGWALRSFETAFPKIRKPDTALYHHTHIFGDMVLFEIIPGHIFDNAFDLKKWNGLKHLILNQPLRIFKIECRDADSSSDLIAGTWPLRRNSEVDPIPRQPNISRHNLFPIEPRTAHKSP